MSDIYIAEKLRKILRQRQDQVKEILLYGAVIDFTDVKCLRARLQELEHLDQDLNDLLKKLGTDDDD